MIYVLESFVDVAEGAGWLGLYLSELMVAHGYEVTSDVRFTYPQPEVLAYPPGKVLVRAEVDVSEFDVEL